MTLQDQQFGRAVEISRRFLMRWNDFFTRSERDDLAQETALEVWRCRHRLCRPDRFEAFVRTVSRRIRYRAIRHHHMRSGGGGYEIRNSENSCVAESVPEGHLCVDGLWVRKSWLLDELERRIERLGAINRVLVRSFYAGVSCRALAEQFDLAERAVRVRLYRMRRRLHREFVGRARSTFL